MAWGGGIKAKQITRKLVDEFLGAAGVKPKTETLYRQVMYRVLKACEGNPRASADVVIQGWYRDLKVAGSSRRVYGIVVNTFFGWCVKRGVFRVERIPVLRPPRVGMSKKHVLTRKEFDRLVKTTDDTIEGLRDRAIFRLLISTGLRISSVAAIELGDITMVKRGDRQVPVLRYLAKGHEDKDQTVTVGSKALEAIKEYLAAFDPPRSLARGSGPLFLKVRNGTGPISYIGYYRMIKHRIAQAGLDSKVGPHSFRHMAAVEGWRQTRDLRAVQKKLGHRSMVTTEGYLRSLDEMGEEDDGAVVDW